MHQRRLYPRHQAYACQPRKDRAARRARRARWSCAANTVIHRKKTPLLLDAIAYYSIYASTAI